MNLGFLGERSRRGEEGLEKARGPEGFYVVITWPRSAECSRPGQCALSLASRVEAMTMTPPLASQCPVLLYG